MSLGPQDDGHLTWVTQRDFGGRPNRKQSRRWTKGPSPLGRSRDPHDSTCQSLDVGTWERVTRSFEWVGVPTTLSVGYPPQIRDVGSRGVCTVLLLDGTVVPI